MAESVIGATVEVLVEKLLSFTNEEVSSLRNCYKDLDLLKNKVSMIQAFILDAERRQVEDHSIELWLKRLETVAEKAEYLFDEFRYESLKRQVKIQNNPIKKVGGLFSHNAFKRKMSQKIKSINEELTTINQSAKTLGLQSLGGPSRPALPIRETDSLIVASEVVGREKDVAEIMEKMLNLREDVVLFTIPIVGMGGLGKTNVAKTIFNDKDIVQRFEKRVWLCQPELSESKIKTFLELILESSTQRKVEVQSRDVIVQKLRDELGRNKCLLVLDDLWEVDHKSWDDFVDTLKRMNPSKGNCIIVTTRIDPVASAVAPDRHKLEELAEDHCWSIFKQRAFVDREVPEEFVSMRDKIVEMCQGLPLAASVLGGLLRNKEKHKWQEILEASPLIAGKNDHTDNNIRNILKLSYDYLPSPHLKKCFAYFAMFQKDEVFIKDELIQLWMAEGFLPPRQDQTHVMEDVGDSFFRILLQNSLLLDALFDEQNNITRCKMHDLVHDLAGDILKYKLFDPKFDGGENHSHFRYFGWCSPSDQINKMHKATRLCTLFWRRNISNDMLLNFLFLRVLNLSMSGIEELPASIGKVIYLRYLDLSWTMIEALPNSICMLYNLRTLMANNCHSLKEFPDEMGNMISLRYLDLSGTMIDALPNSICKLYNLQTLANHCNSLKELPDEMGNMVSLRHIYYRNSDKSFQMPPKMGRLTCLQTLQFFKVGLTKGRRIEELGCLKTLRGELAINGLQLVADREEARRACLHEKSNIYKLAFLWSHDGSEGSETNDGYVLDGLQPHRNLKAFSIEGYLGTRFPSWFSEVMLPNLVKLKLKGCNKCIEYPSLGQLKLLRHLELVGFHMWECIGPAFYGVEVNNNGSSSTNANIQVFLSLKELVLEDMPRLIEWKGVESIPIANGGRDGVGVRMFPSLEKLTIRKCPLLKCTPNQFEVLRELSIDGVEGEMPLLNLCNNFTLQNLWISGCKDFSELPQSLYNLHSLKALYIWKCPNFSSFPVPSGQNHLTSLRRFIICNCGGLSSLPSGMLDRCRSLESLDVSRCDNLVSFPLHFGEMPSLSRLNISRCPKLKSVPTGGLHGLTGLCDLVIGPFSESVDFDSFQSIFNGIQQLPSLRGLWVNGREHFDSLPYQMMQLSALTQLHIYDFGIKSLDFFLDALPKLQLLYIYFCPLLEAISDGLGNLVYLEDLIIMRCRKLQHLPSRDAMLRLTKLRVLFIECCHPELEESCSNRSDPNSHWSNISHIPKITVNGKIIQNLSDDY